MSKITIRLPRLLIKRAKHQAVEADMDLQDLVERALRDYFATRNLN